MVLIVVFIVELLQNQSNKSGPAHRTIDRGGFYHGVYCRAPPSFA